MGSVAVLQPKDCLPRFVNTDRRRHITNPNPNPNMNRSVGRRKRSPGRNSSAVDNNAAPTPAKELVMEQVKILKRGEVLGDMTNTNTNSNTILKGDGDKSKLLGKSGDNRKNVMRKNDKKVKFEGIVKNLKKKEKVKFEGSEMKVDVDLMLSTTDWLGPAPEKLPPKLSDFYAGTGFFESPSPSSLPLPFFLR